MQSVTSTCTCLQQRCVRVVVDSVDNGAQLDERAQPIDMFASYSDVTRCVAKGVDRVDIDAGLADERAQQTRLALAPHIEGEVNRRISVSITRVGQINATIEQQSHDLDAHRGRMTHFLIVAERRATLDQQCDALNLAPKNGRVERRRVGSRAQSQMATKRVVRPSTS